MNMGARWGGLPEVMPGTRHARDSAYQGLGIPGFNGYPEGMAILKVVMPFVR